MNRPEVRFVPVKLPGSVTVVGKRVRQANGQYVSRFSIDSDSPMFAKQLSVVFAKNVVQARRANKGVALKIRAAAPKKKGATKKSRSAKK